VVVYYCLIVSTVFGFGSAPRKVACRTYKKVTLRDSDSWLGTVNHVNISAYLKPVRHLARICHAFVTLTPTSQQLHRVSKNVPHLAYYNFDTHEWILIFFGRNVTDKVGNQKTLYYSALPGKTGKHENHIFTQLDCVTRTKHLCAVFLEEKKSCHLWCLWWCLTFVEIVRYPINTVHWLLFQAGRRTTPIFHTATAIVTDLANTEHVGNRQQDAMLPS